MDAHPSLDDPAGSERVRGLTQAYCLAGHDDTFVIVGTDRAFSPSDSNTNAFVYTATPAPTLHAANQHSPFFYLYLLLAAITGAAIMYGVSHFVHLAPFFAAKSKNEDAPETSTNSTTTTPSSTATTPPPPPVSYPHHNTSVPSSIVGACPAGDSGPPHLIPDDEDRRFQRPQASQQALVVSTAETVSTAINPHARRDTTSVLIEYPQTTVKDLRETVRNAAIMKQHSSEFGLQVKDDLVLQLAIQDRYHNRMSFDQRCAEERNRYFEKEERRKKREQKDKHHKENLDAAQQDKDWMSKVQGAKEHGFQSLGTAVTRCILVVLVVTLFATMWDALQDWHAMSYEELFCYGSGTSKDPLQEEETAANDVSVQEAATSWSSWFSVSSVTDYFGSTTRIMTWPPSLENFLGLALVERASCLWHTGARAVYLAIGLLMVQAFAWLTRWMSIPRCIEQPIRWYILISWVYINDWMPTLPTVFFRAVGFSAVVYYVMGVALLQYNSYQARQTFQKLGVAPSISQVNAVLGLFEDTVLFFQVTPVVLGVLASAYCWYWY